MLITHYITKKVGRVSQTQDDPPPAPFRGNHQPNKSSSLVVFTGGEGEL